MFDFDDLDEQAPMPGAGGDDYPFLSGGAAPTGKTPWIRMLGKAKPDAKARLVLFSWTGNRGGQGSAHNFMRSASPRWGEILADFEPYEVNWTGRGMRMKETLVSNHSELVAALSGALAEALAGGKPVAFMGFSFGAVLAFECARALQARGCGPICVVAASAEAPSWSGRSGLGLARMDEAQFIEVLREKGGTDFILNDEGMTRMMVPVIKSDVVLEETYEYDAGRGPLNCPLLVYHGTTVGHDKMKSLVSADDSAAWLEMTSCRASSSNTALPCDWYIFQDAAGCEAVAEGLAAFCAAKLG